MLILALDFARITGWAYGDPFGQPVFGTWDLMKTGGLGGRYVRFENALIDFIEDHRPDRIYAEAPLRVSAMNNELAAHQAHGLDAHARQQASRNGIPYATVDAQAARREVLGRSSWPRKGEVKVAVVRWCHAHGHSVLDHNAGDAVVIWSYFARRLRS